MNGYGTGKDIMGLMKFIALMVIAVLAIAVLDWLPGSVDKGGMRKYSGMNELRTEQSLQPLMVPSFFPERVAWPPSLLMAQASPFVAVVMEFNDKDGAPVLSIAQSASEGFEAGGPISMSEVRQSLKVKLAGRDALLETGLCQQGAQCSSLRWSREGQQTRHVRMIMKAPSVTLLRIAESML